MSQPVNARLDAVERRSGTTVHLSLSEIPALPQQVETNLYRIALEALNNSLKYARASRVDITLCVENERLTLTVTKDGVGFDTAGNGSQGGLGLDGMQERARQIGALFNLESAPGKGVSVVVDVPL